MRTSDLEYDLPEHLIATRPAEPRDSARMMVIHRLHQQIEHRRVSDLPEYIQAGDTLVFNNTSVIPARLIGTRADTGGRVEGLFLDEVLGEQGNSTHWRVYLKAGGRLKPGQRIQLLDVRQCSSEYGIELIHQDEFEWTVKLLQGSTQEALEAVGWTPLPPYILRKRGEQTIDDELDRKWYQTVYADDLRRQSVAAPTAGLHFTPKLLNKLLSHGVNRIDVTLHVGAGTFRPVATETLQQHRMHTESFEVSRDALEQLKVVANRRSRLSTPPIQSPRLIAVGTTSTRTIESLPPDWLQICGPIVGMTDLMIAPPYEFRLVDGMLTNFHLPRSTLLALVAAMIGLERLKAVYREAIERGYRFYSYGDAMLILP